MLTILKRGNNFGITSLKINELFPICNDLNDLFYVETNILFHLL